MAIGVCGGPEAEAEIAFIASSAAEWSYKENSVENVFYEPSLSGLEDCVATAVRTKGRLTKNRHDTYLPFQAGSKIIHQKRPWTKVGHWVPMGGELRATQLDV